jgi:NAD+ synthase (glutamine-hydrolysing)
MYYQGFLKVEAATPKTELGHIEFNKKAIIDMMNESKSEIIVFPELSLTGYTVGDLFYQQSFIDEAKEALKFIMNETTYQGIAIIGCPLLVQQSLYNVAVVLKKNTILGVIPKHYLPNHHEFYEKRWFTSGYHIDLKMIQSFWRANSLW